MEAANVGLKASAAQSVTWNGTSSEEGDPCRARQATCALVRDPWESRGQGACQNADRSIKRGVSHPYWPTVPVTLPGGGGQLGRRRGAASAPVWPIRIRARGGHDSRYFFRLRFPPSFGLVLYLLRTARNLNLGFLANRRIVLGHQFGRHRQRAGLAEVGPIGRQRRIGALGQVQFES